MTTNEDIVAELCNKAPYKLVINKLMGFDILLNDEPLLHVMNETDARNITKCLNGAYREGVITSMSIASSRI